MPVPCRIRDATPADASVVVEFNRLLAWESEGKQLDPAVLAAGVAKCLADSALGRYFVAEIDRVIIGQTMLTYEWSDWRNGMFWWIQSVYVRPEHRGQGVFRSLFEHIASLARCAPDVCGLRLYVEQHNTTALETYRRMGMHEAGYIVYETDVS